MVSYLDAFSNYPEEM